MTTPLSDERIDELAYRLKGTVTNPSDWWCEADRRWWKTQGHHPQCDLDAALRDADE